jgi:flagellum-specific peptidoglycan hydrolase FlgJ
MARHLAPQDSVVSRQVLTSGGDFDFFGKTQQVADVMEEEQMTYARRQTGQKPPPTQAARQAEVQQSQQHSTFAQQLGNSARILGQQQSAFPKVVLG